MAKNKDASPEPKLHARPPEPLKVVAARFPDEPDPDFEMPMGVPDGTVLDIEHFDDQTGFSYTHEKVVYEYNDAGEIVGSHREVV